MDTYFAPAQRTERRKFANPVETISRNPIMDSLLKIAAGILVVVNEDRQIVALKKKREPFLHSDCLDKSLTNL